jgi:hypothetical protein
MLASQDAQQTGIRVRIYVRMWPVGSLVPWLCGTMSRYKQSRNHVGLERLNETKTDYPRGNLVCLDLAQTENVPFLSKTRLCDIRGVMWTLTISFE